MELRHVETFLTLADELHFGRAAVRLQLTQPRVSQLVQELEREVGAALFDRTRRPVRLTALGERFRGAAADGYEQLIGALRDSQRAAREVAGRLRVGYLPGLGDSVTRVVSAFEAGHPDSEVVFSALALPAALVPYGLLADGHWDVVVAWAPSGDTKPVGLTVGPMMCESPHAVLAPEGHPVTKDKAISLEDLRDYELLNPSNTVAPHLRDLWTPRVTPSGHPLRHTTDDLAALAGKAELTAEDVLILVARGRGLFLTVTALMKRFRYPGLTLVPIHDLPPKAVVPMWLTAAETAIIRMFAAFAAAGKPDLYCHQ